MNRRVERDYLERFLPYVAVSYKLKEVKLYLSKNPELFDDKRSIELLCGAILSAAAKNLYGESFHITILLRPEARNKYKSKPSISQIVNDKLIADTDVDCILLSENRVYFIQLARFVQINNIQDPMRNLFQLIENKCKVQEDRNLVLAILCDARLQLDTNKLFEFVDSLPHFPYSRLHIMVQFGEKPQRGLYHCISIYPELQEPQSILLYLY